MNLLEAIRLRKSIRGYKPDPVPRDVLWEILEIATRSPSALNAQPWEITVVAGGVLEDIKRANIEMLASGVIPNPDAPMQPLEGMYKQRAVDLAIQLFQLVGIAREDKEKRAEWIQCGFRFFDAPAAIILSADRSVDESRTQFDIGLITQTICLTALHYGLGTCIGIQGVMYPEVVRRFTGIPESKRITISIAIGYPDWESPANKLNSKREPLEAIATWHGFN